MITGLYQGIQLIVKTNKSKNKDYIQLYKNLVYPTNLL